jgi:hypothetical protein
MGDERVLMSGIGGFAGTTSYGSTRCGIGLDVSGSTVQHYS